MAEAKIAKPNMRNLVLNYSKKHIVYSIVFGLAWALAWKYGHTEPLIRKYENFYKVYDPVKAESEMADAGLLQSYNTLKELKKK